LLRFDVFGLEGFIRPPVRAGLEQVHGFGKELVSACGKRLDIDGACFDRPEPPAAGRVF